MTISVLTPLMIPVMMPVMMPEDTRHFTRYDTLENAPPSGPVGRRIADKLAESVAGGGHVAVVDESHMHNVPRGAETHFKVLVVSTRFQGMPLIQVSVAAGQATHSGECPTRVYHLSK
jgi:stress-induced morphogen